MLPTRFSSLLLTLLLFFLQAGCITVADRDRIPIDNLPPTYSVQGQHNMQNSWWLDFNDPVLNELVNQAIRDNFTIRIAEKRIEQLRATARQTGASLTPELSGALGGSTTDNHTSGTSQDSFLFKLAASYEIDLWGRLRSNRDAALLDLEATEADFQTARLTVASELARTWYLLLETQLQLQLLTEQQQVNNKVLKVILSQFRAGLAGISDVLQQRQLVENNNENIANINSNIRQQKHQLAILLGTPPGTVLNLPLQPLPELPPLPATGIPLELIINRPDIVGDFKRLQASDYRVASATADRLPRLSISADLSNSATSSGELFNNWLTTLGANLFGPLFDDGYRKAEVDKKTAIAGQNFLKYGQTIIEAIGEVEDALVKETEQQLVLQSQENQLQLAAETIQHVGNRYRQGAEDYQRVLLALLSQQGLQREILQSKRLLINNRIALYRAVSGPLPLTAVPPSSEQ